MVRKKYISAIEAGKKLGVPANRVARLVRTGKVKGRIEVRQMQTVLVDAAVLDKALMVTCRQCGTLFKPKAIGVAKFCSMLCKSRFNYAVRQKRRAADKRLRD